MMEMMDASHELHTHRSSEQHIASLKPHAVRLCDRRKIRSAVLKRYVFQDVVMVTGLGVCLI